MGLVGAGAEAALDVVVGLGGTLDELGEVTTGLDGAADDEDEGLGAAGVVLPAWLVGFTDTVELEAGLIEDVCCCCCPGVM